MKKLFELMWPLLDNLTTRPSLPKKRGRLQTKVHFNLHEVIYNRHQARWLLNIFLLFTFQTFAQNFVAEATLPEVKQTGFHKILIGPSTTSLANANLSNLRIISGNNEVPYILSTEFPVFSSTQFREHDIVSKEITPNCCTKLLLRNQQHLPIRNLSLLIKNAEIQKSGTLLGSDDQKTWYALKEDFYFNAIDNSDQTFEVRVLNFPLSNYEYLSLVINDSTSAPLNILKVGYYETETTFGQYTEAPGLRFTATEKKTEKQSIINIKFDSAQLIDKLEISITSPAFYHRQAALYENTTRNNRKGKTEPYQRFLTHVELTSTHAATLSLDYGKLSNLSLVIENEDNQPLTIQSIQALQLNRYATAWLEAGKSYSVKIGDDNLTAPSYDLAYFKEKIPANSPALVPSQFTLLNQVSVSTSGNIFVSTAFIWSAIVLVGLILGYMSWKLVQEKK